MKTTISAIALVVLVLGFAGITKAATVEFNLFDLGCPTTFSYNSSRWRTDIDLGIPVSEISHVYIDWSGTFTASLLAYGDDPANPFPMDVSLSAELVTGLTSYSIRISGGESAYPAPQSFTAVSNLFNVGSWSPSEPYINFRYSEPVPFGKPVNFVEHGSLTLNDATLIIEGTIVPEPASLFLLALGGLFLKRGRK
jgi:hypothetical protein